MKATSTRTHMFPATRPDRQPSPWWYYGRALYVSRRDYFKIYCALMATLGIPMVFVALYFDWKFMKVAALGVGTVSLFYLGYSLLVSIYRRAKLTACRCALVADRILIHHTRPKVVFGMTVCTSSIILGKKNRRS